MEPINFLVLSSLVFSVGFLGIFVNRKNLITILMSIELMLLSANINFIRFSNLLETYLGKFSHYLYWLLLQQRLQLG